jgi:hypothetical protein
LDRWSTPVDLYCERTDPSFWAEPVNALTNGAFLIAAMAAWVVWRRLGSRQRDWPALTLIVIAALVGIGSFVFHTFATRGAALFDTIPIAVFIYCYLFIALRRFLGLPLVLSLVVLLGFAALSHGLAWVVPRGFLNGSYYYLPALAALLVIAWLTPKGRCRRHLILAADVFMASIALRTVDLAVCAAFPLGTHFLWHSLNGVVFYLLLRAVMDANVSRPAAQPPVPASR